MKMRISYYYRCSSNHMVHSYKPLNTQKEIDEKCKRCLREDMESWRESVGE